MEAYLQLGVGRVILGTVAKENPALVKEACRLFPGQIVVGIDANNGFVAVRGWADVTEKKATEMAKEMEGFGVESINIPVIASGGVSSLQDIENLLAIEEAGISGVITGKAIYSGALDLRQAVALTKRK